VLLLSWMLRIAEELPTEPIASQIKLVKCQLNS